MATLAATLKSEIRRLAAKELKKALKPLRKIQKNVRALRAVSRGHKRDLARMKRRLALLKARASRGAAQGGPRVSPEAIRALRSRYQMTRVRFAKLLGVSPGSIFGWETGRTTPRGRSRARILEVRKMGVRGARSLGKGARRRRRGRAKK
jgi:DNA-binding transcriptional regulator YiaG